jgi:hypothetical protein
MLYATYRLSERAGENVMNRALPKIIASISYVHLEFSVKKASTDIDYETGHL